MSHDDLLVRNAIRRMGVNASAEWTRQCIAFKQKQDSSLTSFQDLTRFIFEMYLLADFRILEPTSLLPNSLNTPHKQRLFLDFGTSREERLGPMSGGGVILQILDVQDIGVSSLKMLEACETLGVAGDQPGGFQVGKTLPKGMIALDLTDGIKKMRAMVIEPIPGIAMEMKLGAKIRIKDVEVRHGVLQLNSSNTLLLGGEVANMNQYPRRMVVMNQMKGRLGMPLDTLTSIPALPTEPLMTGRANTSTATTAGFAAPAPYTSSAISSNNVQNSTNIWRNPQQAFNAQDSIPFTSSSNQSGWQAPEVDKSFSNPWRSFQPTHSSKSLEGRGVGGEDGQNFQPQGEHESQWDYYDMDMDDDIVIPDDDWEVMPQLSADSGQQMEHNPNTSHQPSSGKDGDAPSSMEIDSTVQASPPTRRKISLRSPQSHQKKQQSEQEEPDSHIIQAEVAQLPKQNSKGGPGGSETTRGGSSSSRDAILDDSHDTNRPLSPRYDGAIQNKHLQKVVHTDSISKSSTDDSGYNDYLESIEDVHRSETPRKGVERNKRRVSPEHESEEQDFYTNRRRSRSFPVAPLLQNTAIKVDVEKDNDQLVKVKIEKTMDTASAAGIVNENPEDPWSQNRNHISFAKSTGLDSSLMKIKTEVMNTQKSGASDPPTIIDLLSDDDSSGEQHATSKLDQGVSGIDILKKVKSEPHDGTPVRTKSASPYTERPSSSYHSDAMAHIKQEETLLEFDMDDEDGFEGLLETTHRVPEVELEQAVEAVRAGREVRATARIHKLGKFVLTTLSVSIPIFLQPVAQQTADITLEAVLDQSVVQQLMEYSHSQFKDLIVHNPAEAKRAVAKLRKELSTVESAECHFRGLRGEVPVVRVLNVISRKRE